MGVRGHATVSAGVDRAVQQGKQQWGQHYSPAMPGLPVCALELVFSICYVSQ